MNKADMKNGTAINSGRKKPGLFNLLKPYKLLIFFLILLTLFVNGINLALPKLIANAIDAYSNGRLQINEVALTFTGASLIIFLLMFFQGLIQVYLSEKVAKNLRERVADKISWQSYLFIQMANPSKLLTNLTADIDNIKLFVSQAIVNLFASVILITGASTLLIITNWKLALVVLLTIPAIGLTFFIILRKVRVLFKKAGEMIDRLNRILNENIIGASLIRVLNVEKEEISKFLAASTEAKNIGLNILSLFAVLIPVIIFVSNIATLAILTLGGYYVIAGEMTLGDFSAFNGYLFILIFPILLIGFMSSLITQANVSYQRLEDILQAPETKSPGAVTASLKGKLEVREISLKFGEKYTLNNISFTANPGNRVAIIGPTAAGKTQMLYLLTGLTEASSGKILYDGIEIEKYDKDSLHTQIGLVFQDSIMFNLSLRENISFNKSPKGAPVSINSGASPGPNVIGDTSEQAHEVLVNNYKKVTDNDLKKAVETAELNDFIESLPDKLDTYVMERGTSLSGGQKQRIMLARALALNPAILFLDDFTARVDTVTEKKILDNIRKNYPKLTLVSVTQKIEPVKDYEEIIMLMDGELLNKGTHSYLLENSQEYVQIYNSQKSTNNYELHT